MIYTASYFETSHHHGELFSISRSNPPGFQSIGKLPFFIPNSREIITLSKKEKDYQANYINLYRNLCRKRRQQIANWLDQLDPNQDQTLLCWEHKGSFCHRNLVIKFVQRDRPDCYGGEDIESH